MRGINYLNIFVIIFLVSKVQNKVETVKSAGIFLQDYRRGGFRKDLRSPEEEICEAFTGRVGKTEFCPVPH